MFEPIPKHPDDVMAENSERLVKAINETNNTLAWINKGVWAIVGVLVGTMIKGWLG